MSKFLPAMLNTNGDWKAERISTGQNVKSLVRIRVRFSCDSHRNREIKQKNKKLPIGQSAKKSGKSESDFPATTGKN